MNPPISSVVSLNVKLFADDSVSEQWAAMWQMNFAPSKCFTMLITLKQQPPSFLSILCDTPWKGVTSGKGGGGGLLNKFLYGEATPRGPTPYPFMYYFSRKRYPFRFPSIEKWYRYHIPCLEPCITFKCCKCTIFQSNRKNKTFSRLYKALKFIC